MFHGSRTEIGKIFTFKGHIEIYYKVSLNIRWIIYASILYIEYMFHGFRIEIGNIFILKNTLKFIMRSHSIFAELYMHYIYIYKRVCVCVCVCVKT